MKLNIVLVVLCYLYVASSEVIPKHPPFLFKGFNATGGSPGPLVVYYLAPTSVGLDLVTIYDGFPPPQYSLQFSCCGYKEKTVYFALMNYDESQPAGMIYSAEIKSSGPSDAKIVLDSENFHALSGSIEPLLSISDSPMPIVDQKTGELIFPALIHRKQTITALISVGLFPNGTADPATATLLFQGDHITAPVYNTVDNMLYWVEGKDYSGRKRGRRDGSGTPQTLVKNCSDIGAMQYCFIQGMTVDDEGRVWMIVQTNNTQNNFTIYYIENGQMNQVGILPTSGEFVYYTYRPSNMGYDNGKFYLSISDEVYFSRIYSSTIANIAKSVWMKEFTFGNAGGIYNIGSGLIVMH